MISFNSFMAERETIQPPWEKIPSVSVPSDPTPSKEEPDPTYDGIKSPEVKDQETGLVYAEATTSQQFSLESVNVTAPQGIHFHCCGIYQQTDTYTTRVVCHNCGKMYQLVLNHTGQYIKDASYTSQWLPSGVAVELTEDYQEHTTQQHWTLKKGYQSKTALDYGVLPVDRTQEVLIPYTPTKTEWPKKDQEPPTLLIPVPIRLLRRV